jgi:hypothetical protein
MLPAPDSSLPGRFVRHGAILKDGDRGDDIGTSVEGASGHEAWNRGPDIFGWRAPELWPGLVAERQPPPGLTPAGTDVVADDRARLTEAEPSSPAYELRPDAPDVPDGSVSWAPFSDVWSPDAILMCWIFVCAAFGSVRRSTPCS